jgi:competence protein ComEA
MYFTKTQLKAILFLVAILSVAIAYHFIKQILYPQEPFDFSQFEEKFDSRRDSIAKILEEGMPPQSLPDSTQPVKPTITSTQNQIININTADKNELTTLPRIGPVIAQRIIDYRNENGKFVKIEDIKNVKGIGEKTFDNLKDLITAN